MTTRIVIAIAGLALCLRAQQPNSACLAAKGGSAIDSRLVSLDREWEDQQGTHFTFTNRYSKPLTALFVFMARFSAAGRQMGQAVPTFDSLINRVSDTPVEPNGQRTVTIGIATFKPGETHISEMAAAVFSDGTASGDPRAIQIVQDMRRTTAEMLSAVIGILSAAQASGQGMDTITSGLNACEKTMLSRRSDNYVRGIPRLVTGDALSNLKMVDPAKPSELNRVVTRLIGDYARWLAMFG